MEVKILGSGGATSRKLEQLTREVAAERGIVLQLEHVHDLGKIAEYPVQVTPALVVDGDVKVCGRLPSREELARWLGPA